MPHAEAACSRPAAAMQKAVGTTPVKSQFGTLSACRQFVAPVRMYTRHPAEVEHTEQVKLVLYILRAANLVTPDIEWEELSQPRRLHLDEFFDHPGRRTTARRTPSVAQLHRRPLHLARRRRGRRSPAGAARAQRTLAEPPQMPVPQRLARRSRSAGSRSHGLSGSARRVWTGGGFDDRSRSSASMVGDGGAAAHCPGE